MSGDAEGGDADGKVWYFLEGLAAAAEGGAGGEDVVDQQNVSAGKVVGVAQGEGAGNVLLAVGRGLEALLACVAVTAQGAGVYLAVHDLGNAAAEQFALVVAALDTTPPVERYGHKQVDVVEATRGQELESHLASHLDA